MRADEPLEGFAEGVFECSDLIYRLKPHGYGKEVLRGRDKVYLADAAIPGAVMLLGRKLLEQPERLGAAVETAFFKHAYTWFFSSAPKFTYWRDKKNKDYEVDLISELGDRLVPFEVKYRIDLEAAGIAYAVEGPDGPEYADFHSLRHSFLTLGGRSGIDLWTLQELAGHSKPELTARYSHRRLFDLAGAVAKMPNLVLPNEVPESVPIPLRMTGTDGDSGVVPGVVSGGIRPRRNAPMCTLSVFGGGSDDPHESLEIIGAGASQHRPASISINEGDGGRTRNLRSDSPLETLCNCLLQMILRKLKSPGVPPGVPANSWKWATLNQN